ncbi:alpha/beta fold hydrolase [Vibrio sp. HN007]|uniref:alpha/beta fold hydrolase n=1 Tax=Vibrio iocasae TaxID=3098914 RepID=UPI0035D4527E
MEEKHPILLIRGLLREERHWGKFPDFMQTRFPDRPILTLSLAGTGVRHQQVSPNTISAMTEDLRTELSRKHPQYSKINILGISMGGMIAIDWAARYPEQLNKVILMNTSTREFGRVYERLRWQAYGNFVKSLFSDTYGQEAETLKLLSNRPFNQTLADEWGRLRLECPMSGKTMINQLLASARFHITEQPKVPTLVMTSLQDKMVSPKCSYRLAEAWNLRIEKHPTAGHDISIDDPEWVCEVTKEFLDRK